LFRKLSSLKCSEEIQTFLLFRTVAGQKNNELHFARLLGRIKRAPLTKKHIFVKISQKQKKRSCAAGSSGGSHIPCGTFKMLVGDIVHTPKTKT